MEGVYPLISLHLAGFVLEGLCLLFNDYIAMLIKAVPGLARDGKVSVYLLSRNIARRLK